MQNLLPPFVVESSSQLTCDCFASCYMYVNMKIFCQANEEDIKKKFEQYGSLKEVTVPTKKGLLCYTN